MKRGTLWFAIAVVAVLGIALTQGRWNWQGNGYGNSMMQGYGMGGMMGGMGGGMGMMSIYPAQAQPILAAEAKARLEAYARRFAADAKIKEVMSFSENYYAQVINAKGEGVAEVLADRYTGNVYPEPGPNMMWNARSGVGFGMMGNQNMMGTQVAPQAVRYDKAAAQKLAEQFLKGYLPGAKVLEGQAFTGYYTFDYGRKDIEGMLSVSAYSGEVWVHTWHGVYLGE